MEPEGLVPLLLDINHWIFEILAEVIFFVGELLIIRKLIAWYDQTKHGHRH